MNTLTFAYAYVCTDPAAEDTYVLGRFLDGPYEIGFPAAARVVGSPVAVRHMRGLRYTGYAIGGGLVADWGDGMFIVFSDDADLSGCWGAERDPAAVPAPAGAARVMPAASAVVPIAASPKVVTEVTDWTSAIWGAAADD